MTRRGADNGFTLIELLVTVSLMSVLGGVALTTFVGYSQAQELEGTADDVVSTLRTTAQRAVTEGRTYCVRFDTSANTYTTYRSSCATSSPVAVPAKEGRGPAVFTSPSFTPADSSTDVCPTGDDCAYFYPRGTGSPGSVVVERPGRASITISIEGLTSRVVRS